MPLVDFVKLPTEKAWTWSEVQAHPDMAPYLTLIRAAKVGYVGTDNEFAARIAREFLLT